MYIQKVVIGIIALFNLVFLSPVAAGEATPISKCPETDALCRDFEQLVEAQQAETVIARFEAAKTCSAPAQRYVGEAYLQLASRDNVTPEQEEGYYRKALAVNHTIAYMGLYFFYVQKDEEKALDFLREYVKTKPADTVPYVILGESELDKKNYALADAYLREAKKVAHAHSPRVDWMLFQANYLLKNYSFAKEMFESAVTKGKFDQELKTLSSDPRFDGIEQRPEFRSCKDLFKPAQPHS